MKKIILPILLGLGLMAVSCQDKLEIVQKGVVSYDNFYASDADAEAARADMYVNFISNVGGTEGIDNPQQVILNYAADDVLPAGGDKKDHDAFRIFGEFTYGDASGTLKECYQRYYYAIYHANLIISNFTNENRNNTEPKFESAFTKQCVAEARVMRAYLHLCTALMWNRPPLMDRLYDADELPTNAESQDAILKWVIDECDKAIASGSLPVRKGTTDKNSTAIMTVGFANFVAGKAAMFLSTPDYAKAKSELKAIIDSKNYALIDGKDWWQNFHAVGDGNAEKIFEPNFIEDPAYTSNGWGFGQPIWRGRWMVANVLNWRTGALNSAPHCCQHDGWGGGAIQEDFAKKFLEHDGNSPRRRGTFLTEEEWLYEMEWEGSSCNNGTLEEKQADRARGINPTGIFSHGPYFEWKMMTFVVVPEILAQGGSYPADNIPSMGENSNQKNFCVARYAEALLLYAEACLESGATAEGKAALNEIQKRVGVPETELTFQNLMDEKQYEFWFENCRFQDLVRWSNQGKVDIVKLMAAQYHDGKNLVPTVYDALTSNDGATKHELYVTYSAVDCNPFVKGKHEYLPFPLDFKTVNPNLVDVGGWTPIEQ